MTVKNNLPPESQPWGRDIEKRLADLEFGNSVALNRNTNTNDGVLATLNQLSSQITTLADLLSAQISPSDFTQTATNFSLTVSGATPITLTITAPAGYTAGLITALGFAVVVNNTGHAAILQGNTTINSLPGDGGSSPTISNLSAGFINMSQTALVTSTNIPMTMSVNYTDISSASTANRAHLYGTVLWLK